MMTEYPKPFTRVWWEPGLWRAGCKNVASTWDQGIIMHTRIFFCWYRVYAYVACTTTGAPVGFVDPDLTHRKPVLSTTNP